MIEWFWTAVVVWFAWNVVAPILFLIVIGILIMLFNTPRWIKQERCPHDRIFETGACDAVCSDCGKNLGFIGSWRKKALEKTQ